MNTLVELKKEREYLKLLKEVSRAYALISSGRMKRVRKSVESNRKFLDSISQIFNEILYSFHIEAKRISRSKGKEKITFLAHNGKNVSVFVASNTRLYGDILPLTFNKFRDEIEKGEDELTIIGKYGLTMFREAYPNRPYTFFDFPDQEIDLLKMKEIILHLVQYEKIKFYYPKFVSVIRQIPTVFNISTGTIENPEFRKPKKKFNSYYFDPNLENILIFFETQVFSGLFEQTMRESQLAKFASRLIAMDKSFENIEKELEKTDMDYFKTMHNISNKRQQRILQTTMYQ